VKIYSSQKAHHFPPRYWYVDTVTGERGQEMLPPGGVVDEFAYQAAIKPKTVSSVPPNSNPSGATVKVTGQNP